MAYAKVTYTGNGATTNYTVTFPYLDATHVKVYVEGTLKTLTTHYTWLNSTTIQFVTAPANGDTIVIVRNSSQTTRLTDYQDSSTLTATLLDADANQMFYMAQEALDYTGSTMSLSATTDQWDALNKRITNVADPTGAQDAATKAYVDAAPASATAAAASAAAAATSATAAATSATAAAASATSASSSASTATTQASNASTSASTATTQATNASTSATNAATSETNASTSATLAQNWAVSSSIVAATDYSAKQWATKLTTTVDGTSYSAKQYALDAAASALTAAGFTGGDYGYVFDAVGTTTDYGSV